MTTDPNTVVTEEQSQLALLVQLDLVEYMNRQLGEKMDHRVLLAGVAAAAADLIYTRHGWDAVPAWFDSQARMTAERIAATKRAGKA